MSTTMRLSSFAGTSVLLAALWGCGEPDPGMPDTSAMDAGRDAPISTGPCTSDTECAGTYCNPGSMRCCIPAVPSYEICGDRIDQNCDRHDESCGDNDGDMTSACMPGEDPLGGCDCDDERADVRPTRGAVRGAPELCDGIDNDCNGRIDEAAQCCAGCESLGSERSARADVCTEAGECDCAGEPGTGACAAGMQCCSGGCVDLDSDMDNCGICGAACTISSDSCTSGECRCGTDLPCVLDAACTAGSCG
jgi:Notch-like protein